MHVWHLTYLLFSVRNAEILRYYKEDKIEGVKRFNLMANEITPEASKLMQCNYN